MILLGVSALVLTGFAFSLTFEFVYKLVIK